MIVITNGDAAGAALETWVEAEIVPWRDILHDGPVPLTRDLKSLTRIRAAFLAGCGWGAEGRIRSVLEYRDARLAAWTEHEEAVLWFEHDLYDQLQLLQVLDWFGQLSDLEAPVSLVCHDNFISESRAELLQNQFQSRSRVSQPQLDVAGEVWRAFRSPQPSDLLQILKSDLAILPFLKPALLRWLQEYPSVHTGLSRSEQQILSELKTGELPLDQLFQRTQNQEPVRYLGDASFERYVRLLANCPHPLLKIHVSAQHRTPLVRVTQTGLAILEGRLDQVELNGLDKWMGGVHLQRQHVWRWDSAENTLCRC